MKVTAQSPRRTASRRNDFLTCDVLSLRNTRKPSRNEKNQVKAVKTVRKTKGPQFLYILIAQKA